MNTRPSEVASSIARYSREHLPATSSETRDRLMPILYAGGMLALGTFLIVARPRIGRVPPPNRLGNGPHRSRWRRAAQAGRDNVGVFAPTNVTDSIGRSLLIGGTALLIARLLDEAAGREDG